MMLQIKNSASFSQFAAQKKCLSGFCGINSPAIAIAKLIDQSMKTAANPKLLTPQSPSRSLGIRGQQRDETRQAVINAAIALFSQRGFEGTGLPAIATESGVPVPLMLYHFKSKDLIWKEAVSEVYRRVEEHIDTYRELIESAQGMSFYRLVSRAHITALAKHPEYMRILFQEGTCESERLTWMVEKHQNKMSDSLIAIIDRAQREGLLPAMNLAHAKFIVSGAFCLPIVLAAEVKLVTGEDSLSPDFIERHIDSCLRLLLPAAYVEA
jgi:TetR/AcrR family transcriptional regulator